MLLTYPPSSGMEDQPSSVMPSVVTHSPCTWHATFTGVGPGNVRTTGACVFGAACTRTSVPHVLNWCPAGGGAGGAGAGGGGEGAHSGTPGSPPCGTSM